MSDWMEYEIESPEDYDGYYVKDYKRWPMVLYIAMQSPDFMGLVMETPCGTEWPYPVWFFPAWCNSAGQTLDRPNTGSDPDKGRLIPVRIRMRRQG